MEPTARCTTSGEIKASWPEYEPASRICYLQVTEIVKTTARDHQEKDMAQRFCQWPESGTSCCEQTNRRSRLSRAGLGCLRGGDLVEVIGCTMGVSGCRKDGAVVSFENLQPRRDIGGVFFPRLLM
jgi:hypothetical protein